MLKSIGKTLSTFDSNLGDILDRFYINYLPSDTLAFFTGHITEFTKALFYAILALIPLLPIKFLYPYNRPVTLLIYAMLLIMGILTFAILLSFFQIAYSFEL